MGSSSSKPQYYSPQSDYPTAGPYPYATHYYPYPSQGDYGYYYPQLRNDPQPEAVPASYYYYDSRRRPPRRKRNYSLALPDDSRRRNDYYHTRDNVVSSGHAAATATATATATAANDAPAPDAGDAPDNGDVPAPADGDASAPAEGAAPVTVPAAGDPPVPATGDVPAHDTSELATGDHDASAPAADATSAPAPGLVDSRNAAPEESQPTAPADRDEYNSERRRKAETVPARRGSRARNPLPQLPRDVYETEHYRHLHRAQTTGAAGTWRQHHEAPAETAPYKRYVRAQRRSTQEGVKASGPSEELKAKEQNSGGGGGAFKRLRSLTLPILPSYKTKKSKPSPTSARGPGASYGYAPPWPKSQGSSLNPVTSGKPVVVPPDSPLNPTSPFKILYKKKLYPTAAHLFEAQKFIKNDPDLAERIRTCGPSVAGMSALSRKFQADGRVRKDWSLVWRDKMDEVLYLKFTQHPDIRSMLMATGFAPLVDSGDARRPDKEGVNELGKALVRLREKLRIEGAR